VIAITAEYTKFERTFELTTQGYGESFYRKTDRFAPAPHCAAGSGDAL